MAAACGHGCAEPGGQSNVAGPEGSLRDNFYVLLTDLVDASAAVAGTSARSAKIEQIAALLRHVPPGEVKVAVAFLSGEILQGQIGVGYAALGGLLRVGAVSDDPGAPEAPAAAPALTLTDVNVAFDAIGAIAGPGSQVERRRLLAEFFGRATEREREFLVRLLTGDLGQGALEGIMTDAVAKAAGVPAEEVRRAHQLGGSLPEVAQAALGDVAQAALDGPGPGDAGPGGDSGDVRPDGDIRTAGPNDRLPYAGPGDRLLYAGRSDRLPHAGPDGDSADDGTERGDPAVRRALTALRSFTLRVGRPVRPMLAASAPDIAAALGRISPAAAEWKIDGIRIQVHRVGGQVAVFTRTLEDITARVPEIAEAALSLQVASVVLDGEAVALAPDGRPRPFQVTAARTASQIDVGRQRAETPLTPFLFDLLHLNGADLIDAPASERHRLLSQVVPAAMLTPRTVTDDPAAAQAFFADAVARGHEGLVLKSLDSPYRAGRRGSEWIKVKPRHTLDLVILAAEWGHGRRRGVLSNLHLGARDPDTGGLVMLGKTFKGLTDEMLAWQTGRLLELADPPLGGREHEDRREAFGVVRVRPELVVEIAFDGVQASRRYPGGLALRFARVIRFRPDKSSAEADTIGAVREIWAHGAADEE
jgi:ATP-dependent DNA ligase